MSAHGPTVAPKLSFNNEVGLPLTVLLADESTRHLVLEMGASGPGHITYLTDIVGPPTWLSNCAWVTRTWAVSVALRVSLGRRPN